MTNTGRPSANETSWDKRESIILDFESAWQDAQDDSPGIKQYHDRMPDSIALLLELIKIDLEYQWKSGNERHIEDYADLSPIILTDPANRRELIEEELLARRAVQQAPRRQELTERFPADQDWLGDLIEESAIRSESVLADRSVEIYPGQRVGRYEMIEVAGQGAFADVWRAHDTDLQRQVAIKVLRLSKNESKGVFGRFIREARTAASLQHPAIVPVYEINQSGNRPYIVSQFVHGPTLEGLSKQPMSFAESARIVGELARGLSCVHELGIIHRDLKPANVLIGDDNQPMLTDFGLAHVEQQFEATLTQQGDVLGTPAYMSPEQARGDIRRIDSRTDIYALGVILYRLASGRLPFEGTTSTVLYGVIHNTPTPLESVTGTVPPDFKTIVDKCLEKSPSDRYQSARQLADELDRFLLGEPITARPIGWGERIWKWSQRRPKLAAILATCLLLASFCLGTLGQLKTVRQQRNQTRALLAQSAEDAGHLAMKAGHHREAIGHFIRSIDGGSTRTDQLAFNVIEAMVADRQIKRAAEYFTAIPERNVSQAFIARKLLWKAELAWEGALNGVDVIESIESALDTGVLPPDEERYARAMIAGTTAEAIEQFELSLQNNPFHDRSRRKLIAALLSSAQFERARGITLASRQLYPTNTSYIAINALASSVTGNYESAVATLANSAIEPAEKNTWQAMCKIANRLNNQTMPTMLDTNVGLTIPLMNQFSQSCFPLLANNGFRLVPRVHARWAPLIKTMTDYPRDAATVNERIQEVLEIHPEATLNQLQVDYALSQNDWAQALDHADLAQRLPTYLNSTRSESGKTIAAIAAYHLQKETSPRSKYVKLLNDSIDTVIFEGLDANKIRLFVISAIRANNYEKANEIAVKYWDDSTDALWHRAIIARELKRYEEAVVLSDHLLEKEPNNKSYRALRKSVVDLVRQSLSNYEAAEISENDETSESEATP